MTSSVLALCAWLFHPADALVLDEIVDAAENHTVEKINRESRALFSSESRVSMRGHVYPFLGVSCGIWFWVSKRERERSNRVEEGERAAQYGRERESTKRESVQCVTENHRRVSYPQSLVV